MSDAEPIQQDVSPVSKDIDIARLMKDLQLTDKDIQRIRNLNIPQTVIVSSKSAIKVDTVRDTFRILGMEKNVIGVKVPSGVDEQPLGETTISGAVNRLHNAQDTRKIMAPDEGDTVAYVSIENGLFRKTSEATPSESDANELHEGLVFTEDADLKAEFDPDAEYDDRAITAIQIPGKPIVVQISSSSEAVRFPKQAVMAAFNAEGGFVQNTVGSKLKEVGAVQDNQNPHKELTASREGGSLSRQDQMARTIVRGLTRLAESPTKA